MRRGEQHAWGGYFSWLSAWLTDWLSLDGDSAILKPSNLLWIKNSDSYTFPSISVHPYAPENIGKLVDRKIGCYEENLFSPYDNDRGRGLTTGERLPPFRLVYLSSDSKINTPQMYTQWRMVVLCTWTIFKFLLRYLSTILDWYTW